MSSSSSGQRNQKHTVIMSASKFGRTLAKAVGIDVDYRKEPRESMRTAAESIRSLEHFDEDEPSAKEWVRNHSPTVKGTVDYFNSLFPFWNWIFHYNTQWLMGDIIAGKPFPLFL